MLQYIDTHAHLDGPEFDDDLDEVIGRARAAGVAAVFVPGIDRASIASVRDICNRYPGYLLSYGRSAARGGEGRLGGCAQ